MNAEHEDTAEGALTYLDNARTEIQNADDLLTLKEIHDKLSAVKVFCKAAKVAFEITQRCSELKIRCERRAGELLNGREKHPPGPSPQDRSRVATYPPKLEDLDITKSQSSRWQSIAAVPDGDFEKRIDEIKKGGREITSSEMISFAKYLNRERERTERRKAAAEEARRVEPDARIRVFHGDFRVVLADIPDDSVQLICTDPPYAGPQNDFLTLWEDLGKWASEKLAPGKLLIAMCGNYYLFDCMQALSKHLKYTWTSALIYGTSFPDTMFKYRLKTYWKPAIWFSKGEYAPDEVRTPWIHDMVSGDGGSKVHHKWEQGVNEFSHFIDGLTYPGDLVADPFVGSGTTGVAAKRLNRRFIGADEDEASVNMTLARLAQEPDPTEI